MDDAEKTRIDETFRRQQAFRWEASKTDADRRVEWLEALGEAIESRREQLQEALHADFRKHPAETELTEIHPTLDEIAFVCDNLEEWMKPRKVTKPLSLTGTSNRVRYEALGNVLIMSPWNYPFNLTMIPLVDAIAAGNTAMLRPSEKTAHTADVMQEILDETFDDRHVAMIQGDYDVAEYLLEQPFDHYFFTGSPRIGKKVMRAAADHLASVTLELGGKSPAIVTEDADLAAAARHIAWGKYMNAGQTCVAPDYAVVHASVVDEFQKRLVEAIQAEYGPTEAARKASDDFARVIDDDAFERLKALIEASVDSGADVLVGGKFDAEERYVAPTVLAGVDFDAPAMGEEIFGPVLPVLTYEERDEVYEFVQRTGKPLALYLFTDSSEVEVDVFENTSSGGAVINNCLLHFANPFLPFGGVGQSGQGQYHGFWGFTELSHERAVMDYGRLGIAEVLHPPFETRMTEWALKALEFIR